METAFEGLETHDSAHRSAWLDQLPAPLASWFRRRFGQPTEIQRAAWSRLPWRQHLLLSAPTGTGKTLAVFLPILSELIQGNMRREDYLACLYVSPLKALNADTERTLSAVLDDFTTLLPQGCVPSLAVRSGDSTAAQRRRLARHPPDILLTTPESLAVLLSQPLAHTLFAKLRWVVVDEVHALAANKRGADLALSLERLTELAGGQLRRIGLSATATPLAVSARWLGGDGCAIAQAAQTAPLELKLVPLEEGGHFLATLVDHLKPEIEGNRTTLIFTNSRRLAEQLGWALRRNLPELDEQIAVHHSSLSAERRHHRVGRGRIPE